MRFWGADGGKYGGKFEKNRKTSACKNCEKVPKNKEKDLKHNVLSLD